jgi:hypothetical protein
MTNKRKIISEFETELLMAAIEASLKPDASPVNCDSCSNPIEIKRDNDGNLKSASCACGKFNKVFRGI